MNVGKLRRVAIKEFKRSPAKTGFLLVMVPVAMYFCLPLMIGAVKKSSPSTSSAPAAAVPKHANFILPKPSSAVVTLSRSGPSWVDVADSLEHDQWAVPANIADNARNPFAAKKQEPIDEPLATATNDDERDLPAEAEREPLELVEETVAPDNPIRALGLKLNATIVGRRSRVATINGKSYAEGEPIPVVIDTGLTDEAATTLPLELIRVERRFVVLKMDGHELRLQLRNEIPEDAIIVKPRSE